MLHDDGCTAACSKICPVAVAAFDLTTWAGTGTAPSQLDGFTKVHPAVVTRPLHRQRLTRDRQVAP